MSERGIVEAALFVASGNMSAERLGKVCNMDTKRVQEIVEGLIAEYQQRDGGLEVFRAGKEYGMRVKPEYEEAVTKLIPETEMPKAMLKTLAMIAYEQPIKQSYLVKIRGNRVYEYMKRLEELSFIERKDEGHTKIITTTPKFRQYFRINDAKELVVANAHALGDEQLKLDDEPEGEAAPASEEESKPEEKT